VTWRIAPAGDAALLVEGPASIDPGTSGRLIALGRAMQARHGAILRDVVLGYCSLTTYFDPLTVDAGWLETEIRRALDDLDDEPAVEGALLDVPVCYGGELGPDLADVAAAAGLDEAAVVATHSGTIYRVYMLGFTPGFAYMASVDPRLALPRRPTPRTRVPAGSVAIAAGQTAIYPDESPGGWHLIGRTRIRPYDAARSNPFLFHAGDRVRFVPIDRAAFETSG
jgi:KipI family sensor histidine kinase inhibitor